MGPEGKSTRAQVEAKKLASVKMGA
jgi:hypothetical protein